ncbi:SDR family oxidoreductase [Janibacter cremeus]|uniref:SDR family NAD(P)-dependent oxidoreductase n=1 Tax=Janibacter cremeus TaxID=1285192 RepID=UPI0023F75CFC|nr:SDR family oxidoreductase [Janibacter cremeus]WEV77835.1 SDR family oxidoreductase [Janibacter cremeus]
MSRARTALVAGASRGLGLLVARELAHRGLDVAICARDAAELEQAVTQLAGEGAAVRSYVCDVTDRAAVTDLVARLEREHGPLDVAIHVAGIIQVGPLAAMTADRFDEAIDIMLRGPINLALAVLPGMRDRGFGRIGTVTSIGGVVSVPHLLPYSAAKFGAVGFSQGLSAELAGTGVTSTTIVPGLMRTGSHLHAQFTGDAGAEFAWFGPGASLPLVAMDADKAARRMVQGVLAGDPMVTLTPMAHIGRRVAGLAPATTTRLMGLVNRALPSGADVDIHEGMHARTGLRTVPRRVVDTLTVMGDRVARRTNETKPSPFVATRTDTHGPGAAPDASDTGDDPQHTDGMSP